MLSFTIIAKRATLRGEPSRHSTPMPATDPLKYKRAPSVGSGQDRLTSRGLPRLLPQPATRRSCALRCAGVAGAGSPPRDSRMSFPASSLHLRGIAPRATTTHCMCCRLKSDDRAPRISARGPWRRAGGIHRWYLGRRGGCRPWNRAPRTALRACSAAHRLDPAHCAPPRTMSQ